VADPEPLFLVDDQQAQLTEGDVPTQQAMRPDHDVDRTCGEILDHLRRVVQRRAEVRIRFTLVPGVNDTEDHVRRLAGFVSSLGLSEIDVLPYRRVASGSYEALGRTNPAGGFTEPGPDAVAGVCELVAEYGLHPTVVERKANQRQSSNEPRSPNQPLAPSL